MTIEFYDSTMGHLLETRYWYHVPTKGAYIQIWDRDPMLVDHVIWGDGSVRVMLW